jgi:hypothetical protein
MTRYSRNTGDRATPNSNHITGGTLLDTDLNKKMKNYTEQNIAAAVVPSENSDSRVSMV